MPRELAAIRPRVERRGALRSNGVIAILGVLVILLVGALMFTIGRSTSQDPSATAQQRQAEAPAAPDPAAVAASAAAQPPSASEQSTTTTAAAALIPAAFLGDWNASLEDCGTGLDLSRMRVEPQRVLFHESEAEAKRVTIHGPRSITIEGLFQGEGETWNGRLRMDLSASGQALTIGDLIRQRCPS
jgi:hypothetical protein